MKKKQPQTGLNCILWGRRLVHPKLQGMEALFMMVSRSISKSDNQQILLKKGCRKTALISSSRDDAWCIRNSRAWRLCLWWSRGRSRRFSIAFCTFFVSRQFCSKSSAIKRLQFQSFGTTFGASEAPGHGACVNNGFGADFVSLKF